MTTKKIYSPWIKWHGGECPVPPDTAVEVRFRSGICKKVCHADGYWWRHGLGHSDIVEYRTITEQPDLEAAEKLLLANGYTVIPPARPLTFDDVVPMTEAPPDGTVYWVISAGERGQEITKTPSPAYLEAAREVQAWIKERAAKGEPS